MRTPFDAAFKFSLIFILQLAFSFVTEVGHAQTRDPTANETASIRDCATKNRDNLDEGERLCLFDLVAEPCIKKLSDRAGDAITADCYQLEGAIWDRQMLEEGPHPQRFG